MIQYNVPYDDKNVLVVFNPTINAISPGGFAGHQAFYVYIKPVGFKDKIDVSREVCIGSFSLMPLPGNCGGCIGYSMHTTHSQYIKGVDNIRDDLVRKFGYSLIIATAIKSGGTESAIRDEDNGYEIVEEFKNKRTTNNIIVGFKKL